MRTLRDQSRRPASERNFWKQHLLVVLLTLGISASCLAFIAFSNWKQIDSARILSAKTAESNARLDKLVKETLKKRYENAKKAEADAKANAIKSTRTTALTHISENVQCDVTNPSSITVVINKKHCFNPKNWAPANLISYNGYFLQNEASEHLAIMSEAAGNAGTGFSLSSAYRSYDNQVATYDNWVNVNGSVAAADTVSARPGFSEHQTGLAADLKVGNCVLECFGGTASYRWLQEHAAEYGFIERYPPGLTAITGYNPEAWHWRYVGIATAQDMKSKSIQTLETYLGISGGNY